MGISQSPFIGAVAVSFVNDPKIDFNLTELANMFDIPGFDGLLRGGITESVRGIMVFPNKYVIKMVEEVDISALKYPMPEGVLRIHVLEARNLVAKDKNLFKKDTSDPYAVIKVGREFKKRTVTVNEQLNPVWNNEVYDVIIQDLWHSSVEISVYDDDKLNPDDLLGKASIAVKSVYEKGIVDDWIELSEVQHGSIHMKFQWMNLSDDNQHIENAVQLSSNNINTSSTLLSIYVDQAINLPSKNKDTITSNVQLKAIVPGQKDPFKTKLVNFSNPIWEERFMLLIQNPRNGKVRFEVEPESCEVESDNTNTRLLGTLDIQLNDVINTENMTIDDSFLLEDAGPNSKLKLRLSLRTFQPKENVGGLKLEAGEVLNKNQSNSVRRRTAVPSNMENVADDEDNASTIVGCDEISTSDEKLSRRSPSSSSIASEMSIMPAGGNPDDRVVDKGKGRIMLTVRWHHGVISVLVVRAENLIVCDEDNSTSDPYVKVSLPEIKMTKKTKVVKKSLNPTFDELLRFHINSNFNSRHMSNTDNFSLKVSVKNHTGFLSKEKTKMGSVGILLNSFHDLSTPHTQWYALE